jgi:hypothetical protein
VFTEGLPVDEFHDEEVAPGGLLHAMQRGDVRVIERRERFCFTLEADEELVPRRDSGRPWTRRSIAIGSKGLEDHLDGDLAIESRIARTIHLAHSPLHRAH